MGLLYPFPLDSDQEVDHVVINEDSLLLKSYGPPYLFWGYLLALLATLVLLGLAAWRPLTRMLSSQDSLNALIAGLTLGVLVATPLLALAFFFLEFRLFKSKDILVKSLHLVGPPLWKRRFQLRVQDPFSIANFTGTPNLARQRNHPGSERHQNRGYFELYLHTAQGEQILLDRHSRKTDLQKLKALLEKF